MQAESVEYFFSPNVMAYKDHGSFFHDYDSRRETLTILGLQYHVSYNDIKSCNNEIDGFYAFFPKIVKYFHEKIKKTLKILLKKKNRFLWLAAPSCWQNKDSNYPNGGAGQANVEPKTSSQKELGLIFWIWDKIQENDHRFLANAWNKRQICQILLAE